MIPCHTHATSQNGFNNFGRGPPKDHYCYVWSNSTVRFKIKQLKFFLYNSMLNCDPCGLANVDLSGIIWTRTSRWCYGPKMKALCLVVSDRNIFENCILKTYFWHRDLCNELERFGSWPLWDYSISGFREDVFKNKIVDKARTDGLTDGRNVDGR